MDRMQVGLLLGISLGFGCGDSTPAPDNDMGWVPPITADGASADGNLGADGAGADGFGGADGNLGGDGAGGDGALGGDGAAADGAAGDGAGGDGSGEGGVGDGSGDGAGDGSGDGDTGPSAVEQIAGTAIANDCSTYGLPMNGMCGGIYCAVTSELLSQAFDELTNRPNGCDAVPAELACSGITARTVAACARKEKSANPLASNDELRPKIEACAYEEAEIKAKMPSSCLQCYLDAAECSGDNCLIQCLGGDSPTCDQCRLDKGCSRPVADCTGFPNPL